MPARLNTSKIKARREALGLTVDDAAKKAGWASGRSWRRIEEGSNNILISDLDRMAAVLECRARSLITD